MFAAVTTLFAACGSFIYAAFKGKLHELKNKKAYSSLIMITLCIVIIPYTLFFVGSSKTSGINSSLLLLSEIIFTLLFTPFIGEKTTITKLIGAIGIFIGAALILYNGKFNLNIGDVLIIFSTITYPIGNFYSKKALNFVSPAIILLVRFFLGGIFILAIALLIEPQAHIFEIISLHWGLILFIGMVLLGLGKILSYEGLKRLDISKTISLAMTFPIFSLIVLIGFFKEIPSIFQWIGIIIMAVGVYFSVKRQSINPALTKYAP
jgi:drug/metabolite transporter (DMT)-like permease